MTALTNVELPVRGEPAVTHAVLDDDEALLAEGDTAVRTPAALKNLEPGDPVTVEGPDDGSGTVTATSVTRTK